jgi:TolB-like protein
MMLSACLLAPAATGAAEPEIAVAVMEFASKGGIEAQKMDALSDMLANAIRRSGNYRVVGKSDIRAALALEEQKQLLGCSDDSCLAEIGGALGVRWVVVGNISLFGKTYLLNLKVIDVARISVLAGLSQKITGGEDMLIDGLDQAARKLIAEARAKSQPGGAGTAEQPVADSAAADAATAAVAADDEPAPVSEVALAAAEPSSALDTWGHVTFWSGVGLTVVGIGGLIGAATTARKYEDNSDPGVKLDALDNNQLASGLAWIGLGTGAALGATGVILWLVAPDAPESVPAPSAGPTADGRGLTVGVSGRW